jgi:hydroxyethylthiazole kinase
MLGTMLENVRSHAPLVHCITNYVTVNDVANILIACGASPIMSDDFHEVSEITSICGGLVINIGTLNQSTIPSMFLAGAKANELGRPVILDPVGAGASQLRTETAKKLIEDVKFSVIRGNISEIKALALGSGKTKGVDADESDKVTLETLEDTVAFAREFSRKTGAIIAITGVIDIAVNQDSSYTIRNGHSMMSKITGSGCMLSALIGAYLAANSGSELEACAAALGAMGLCGEQAYQRLIKNEAGNSSYRNYLIDEVFNLKGNVLNAGANYEIG